MKIIKANYEILNTDELNGYKILKNIEAIGRTCYKSENNTTDISSDKFVRMLINKGHEAMIEHNSISVKFICDRGVSHELVRHRLASFAQESTRYCNYSDDKFGNEITVIEPCFFNIRGSSIQRAIQRGIWVNSCINAEESYFKLIENGASPQEARTVLPNSLKTEIVMTMNVREWRHFFKLRCDKAAHPQMRELTMPLLKEMSVRIPVVFDDILFQFS